MPISREDLIKAMKLPPTTAIAYFESLGFRPHMGDWDTVLKGARERAFSIANVNDARITESIYNELRNSLRNGLTQKDTIQRIQDTLVKQGYKNEILPPYRLKLIYRANMQNSYNVGRFIQQKARMDTQPYLQRVVIRDRTTRETHIDASEYIYPADHPFWNQNYPPYLGGKYQHGCRCRVNSLSQLRVETMFKQNPNLKIVWETPPDAKTVLNDNPLYNIDQNQAREILSIKDPKLRQALIEKISRGDA